jgi:hypothetical protein
LAAIGSFTGAGAWLLDLAVLVVIEIILRLAEFCDGLIPSSH